MHILTLYAHNECNCTERRAHISHPNTNTHFCAGACTDKYIYIYTTCIYKSNFFITYNKFFFFWHISSAIGSIQLHLVKYAYPYKYINTHTYIYTYIYIYIYIYIYVYQLVLIFNIHRMHTCITSVQMHLVSSSFHAADMTYKGLEF